VKGAERGAPADPSCQQAELRQAPGRRGAFAYLKYLIMLFVVRALPGNQAAWILLLPTPLYPATSACFPLSPAPPPRGLRARSRPALRSIGAAHRAAWAQPCPSASRRQRRVRTRKCQDHTSLSLRGADMAAVPCLRCVAAAARGAAMAGLPSGPMPTTASTQPGNCPKNVTRDTRRE